MTAPKPPIPANVDLRSLCYAGIDLSSADDRVAFLVIRPDGSDGSGGYRVLARGWVREFSR